MKYSFKKGEKRGKWTVIGQFWTIKGKKRVRMISCHCGDQYKSFTPRKLAYIDHYQVFCNMKQRCLNPNSPGFKDYGGRGIGICERWKGKNGLSKFYQDMGPRPKGYQIDRIDNNGDYSPKNCRWVTPKQNHRNKRNNRLITAHGKTLSIAEWAEKTGLTVHCIADRLDSGLPSEKVVDPSPRSRGKLYTFNGKTKNLTQWAKELGVKRTALAARLKAGWSVKKALSTPIRNKSLPHKGLNISKGN